MFQDPKDKLGGPPCRQAMQRTFSPAIIRPHALARLHLALGAVSHYIAASNSNDRRTPHITSTPALDGPARKKRPSV